MKLDEWGRAPRLEGGLHLCSARVAIVARQLAIAMKAVYQCDGISLRQHNEPGGGQDVIHFHLHLFQRYSGDELYQRTDESRCAMPEERRVYAEKLKAYLATRTV